MTLPEELLRRWVLDQAGPEAGWTAQSLDTLARSGQARDLYIFMGLAPRRLGKADLRLGPDDLAAAETARPGWSPAGWSIDGAARVLALLIFPTPRPFAELFKDLRRTADVAELIALYRGLPLYPEPESLDFEVGEGLRSNIRAVFEAIAHDTPYPRDHFDDHRWNHMVLKALFVDTRLTPILGLRERANPELARILVDYAEERLAAGRPVPEDLWIPLSPFREDPKVASLLRGAGREEVLS
ncbi:EboA domain-containing protein [Salipiger thiooxidans]|uniref:EboA domain-containing protein n=1 Tax=Salipiger thiooxidans TaxID=282683 RepID=UPI001CD4FB9C|nr:EboA domain-containing protein [Salipiger thiooxidans]MCA0851131.1 EboA domain-containing protein [Salipiger thiooxidans]